jgi:hypothetical protein
LTHTIQPRSLAFLNERGRDSAANKPETEDNLLLPVVESLKNLSEALKRLDRALKEQEMELNICRKYTGEKY